MHTTLKDFLAAEHEDQIDQLAKRALVVMQKCQGRERAPGMIANAYNRGQAEAYTAVSRAHYEASIAFVLANQQKDYPFAEGVLAGTAVQAVNAEEPESAAAYLVGSAESAVAQYAEQCRPVCMILGDVGVHILRGAHAAEAMKDVRAANVAA